MSAPLIEKYGRNWPADTHPLKIEMACIRLGVGNSKSFHFEQMRHIIWPELDGDHNGQRWHTLTRDEICMSKVTTLMGSGGCIPGHTRLLNPETGEQIPIRELCEKQIRPLVMTLNGSRLADVPYLKGTAKLYEIVLKSGKRFTATNEHRVLTASGFVVVGSLQIGQCLLSYDEHPQPSTSASYPSMSCQDARSFLKKESDFPVGYPACHRFCDAPPPVVKVDAQDLQTSPIGVLTHSHCIGHSDVPVCESARIRLDQLFYRLSNLDSCSLDSRNKKNGLFRCFSGTFLRGAVKFLRSFLSPLMPRHFVPSPEQADDSFRNCSQREKPCQNYRVWTDAVQEIRDVGIGDYYDLNVQVDHHYFAEGCIHHNSGKTHAGSWIFLCDYWVFPQDTIVLVSSTDFRGLDLRVFGEIKKLFSAGQERFPWLAGHMIESKRAISTDDIDEDGVRDLRKGIIGIPCIQNGRFVGLGKYVGIHQKRVRLIADEAQFMNGTFLSAFANLNQNEDFWAIILGNPNDPYDSLGRAAEPRDGWASHMQPEKTACWDTKFMNGRCVNLIGTDSPNDDFPPDRPVRFKYLPHAKQRAETLASFGMDSQEYHNQCVGSMRTGQLNRRVLTHDICREFHAQDRVTWSNKATVKIYGLDSAYGGDRCVGGWIEFGDDVTGKHVLCVHPPIIIPVKIATKILPEDQIADRVKHDCELLGIPPENMFHDATGRGSLGTALARAWSASTNPVEFGGRPSERPVSLDHYIRDAQTNQRRLKLCTEHYVNFVTELWFSIRYTVEADQMRNLPDDVMEELCMRQWEDTKNSKRQVEPKTGTSGRPGMKERTGRSPDLADWLAICLEGARRRGFQISKLANDDGNEDRHEWLADLARKSRTLLTRAVLNHSA